jgi:hypothetical protein
MPPSKPTVSHIFRRKLGQSHDPTGSLVKLSFDTPRDRTR